MNGWNGTFTDASCEIGDGTCVLGGNRRYCCPAGYPAVTRFKNGHVFFPKVEMLPRFGTEGSEVQILSPRPIPKKTCRI